MSVFPPAVGRSNCETLLEEIGELVSKLGTIYRDMLILKYAYSIIEALMMTRADVGKIY